MLWAETGAWARDGKRRIGPNTIRGIIDELAQNRLRIPWVGRHCASRGGGTLRRHRKRERNRVARFADRCVTACRLIYHDASHRGQGDVLAAERIKRNIRRVDAALVERASRCLVLVEALDIEPLAFDEEFARCSRPVDMLHL